jgi:hypothetical protein
MIPSVFQPGDVFQRIRMPDVAGSSDESLRVVSVSGNLVQLEWVVAGELIDTENETRVGHFELADGDLEWVTQQGDDPEIRDDVVLLSDMQAATQAIAFDYLVFRDSGLAADYKIASQDGRIEYFPDAGGSVEQLAFVSDLGGASGDFVSGTFGFETYYGGGAAPTGLDITKVYYESGKSWYWDYVNEVWQALFYNDATIRMWTTFGGQIDYIGYQAISSEFVSSLVLQSFTSPQKAQARSNIGALAASVTKAELNTAISDGNAVFIGDALNGTLGATTPATVAGTTGTFSGVVQPRRLLINGQNSEWPIDVYTSNGVTRIFSVVNGTGDCFSAGTFSSATGFRVTAFGAYIGVLADSNIVFNNGNIVTNVSGTQRLLLNSTGLSISGSLTVNSGTAITKILSATATLDFGSVAANSFADLTITVTGAALGDTVSIGVPNGSLLNDISFFGWVSATNTVTVRCSNVSSTTARDPASGTFRATVTQF